MEKQDNPGHTVCNPPRAGCGLDRSHDWNGNSFFTTGMMKHGRIQLAPKKTPKSLSNSRGISAKRSLAFEINIINVSNSQTCHRIPTRQSRGTDEWNNLSQSNYLRNFQENQFCSLDSVFRSPLKCLGHSLWGRGWQTMAPPVSVYSLWAQNGFYNFKWLEKKLVHNVKFKFQCP